MKQEIFKALLGSQELSQFFASFIFALIGIALMLLLHSTSRSLHSKRSPVNFKWSFFLLDNWKRIAAGVIMIFIALRFTPELFGVQLTSFWAFAIGCINDKIAEVIKNKTNLLGSKISV
jgi:ABC-type Fe3+ transport system permease subunit